MTFSEVQKLNTEVLEAVLTNRLKDALDIIARLLIQAGSSEMHIRKDSLADTYQSMLKYTFQLAPDPERENIYRKLKQSILELSDDLKDFWIENMNLFERKSMLEKLSQFEADFQAGSKETVMMLTATDVENEPLENKKLREDLATRLFYYFWLKNTYGNQDIALFNNIFDNPETDTEIKSLIISAVTLSQLRHFDSEKFVLLFSLAHADIDEIRQRVLVGIFLIILYHQKRLVLYPKLTGRIKSISDDPVFRSRMLAILIQFIRATETEKITRKIQEEIVPEVMKLRTELEDKLKLNDLLSKESFDAKNPEWENVFRDVPDVYQKLEQFSRMQIEGSDVFMGAFSLLKHFPFFRDLSNWFIPFRKYNSTVVETFDLFSSEIDAPAFVDAMEKSTVLCNSDKYSFILNVRNMPAQQSKTMIEMFNMELKAMNEMMDDEMKMDTEIRNKILNTQYLQDLYRFFKLHPNRKEFDNIFEMAPDVIHSELLFEIFDVDDNILNLAEFYFARDRYEEASKYFEWLGEKKKSFELLEKTGYCYQKRGDFTKAIELYHQAELFDRNKLWLQKKLGFCYRKTGNFEKAIEYYKEIVKSEPKDLSNIAYLGQLHMDIGNFEEALKYYYKVEYADPENTKVFRPIGWCSFITGKHNVAIKYFGKVISNKPSQDDYLFLGHAYWVSGEIENALEAYRAAVRQSSNNDKWFRETFNRYKIHLTEKGLDNLDIDLMIDYVLFRD